MATMILSSSSKNQSANTRMFSIQPFIRQTVLAAVLLLISSSAYADAFIPTMISANVIWLLVLVPVVMIEGRIMARWKWNKPYKSSFIGNALSMLAALPLGVLFSAAGHYISSPSGKNTFSFLSDSVRFFLSQVLLYGDTPVPSYGFLSTGFSAAGIFLAALIFIGLCWFLTFVVEGHYYSRKNPTLSKREIYRKTVLINLTSYCFLIALWCPYSYLAASADEERYQDICATPNSFIGNCKNVWTKFPEIKEDRLAACKRLDISEKRCLERLR